MEVTSGGSGMLKRGPLRGSVACER